MKTKRLAWGYSETRRHKRRARSHESRKACAALLSPDLNALRASSQLSHKNLHDDAIVELAKLQCINFSSPKAKK
jgi:hypothetical protein